MIEIPLLAGVDNSHQRFSQRLGGILLTFEVSYVTYNDSPYWEMNILQDGFPIANGIPLNPGSDLLVNQNVIGYGKFVFVGEEPTLDNLGIANNLVWVPE